MAKSILQIDQKCYVCGTTQNLHKHHVFGASNRKWSEKYGLIIILCARHHNMSDDGIHFDKELDLFVKKEAQKRFEEVHGTREDWMRIFARNYL